MLDGLIGFNDPPSSKYYEIFFDFKLNYCGRQKNAPPHLTLPHRGSQPNSWNFCICYVTWEGGIKVDNKMP